VTSDDEQRQLRALFGRTGAEPSPFELTRMTARARELPERLERVPRRLPRWTWAPAFAAFAALGALGLTLTHALSSDEQPLRHPALPANVAPSAPAMHTSGEPSARSAPSSTTPEASFGTEATDEGGDLDDLPFTPDADDDPFDLSTAEETELFR
jgi:hypothetical protein